MDPHPKLRQVVGRNEGLQRGQTGLREDAYEIYGIPKEDGAFAVIRPDGYMGMLGRVDASRLVESYFETRANESELPCTAYVLIPEQTHTVPSCKLIFKRHARIDGGNKPSNNVLNNGQNERRTHFTSHLQSSDLTSYQVTPRESY
jgi:hypothetical protein